MFEWRGDEHRIGALDRLLDAPWDAIIVAVPVGEVVLPPGPCVIALPGTGVSAELAPAGAPIRPGDRLRTPEPLAAIVARVVAALGPAVQALEVLALDAASSLGRPAMDELRDQTIDLLNFREPPVNVLPRRLAFEVLPRTGEQTDPEGAFERDFSRLCPTLAGRVLVERVLVSAFVGVVARLRIEVAAGVTAAQVSAALEADPELAVGETPTLADALGEDAIRVGPPVLRGQVLHLWLAADDTRVGAALLATKMLARLGAVG
ncbi:MAG: Asd/ArgC dimerization domain-containing protein [bacterium]